MLYRIEHHTGHRIDLLCGIAISTADSERCLFFATVDWNLKVIGRLIRAGRHFVMYFKALRYIQPLLPC